jgi:hypothetical protein
MCEWVYGMWNVNNNIKDEQILPNELQIPKKLNLK